MGAITPIASGLTTIVGALNVANEIVSSVQTLSGNDTSSEELALKQLKEQQRLQQKQLAQQNALEREQVALQALQDEEDRRAALRRAVARQRASFGASGVSSGSGSSQAVLLGLVDETEDELAQREALDNLRSQALSLDEAQTRSLTLLQATQLSERNALNNLF